MGNKNVKDIKNSINVNVKIDNDKIIITNNEDYTILVKLNKREIMPILNLVGHLYDEDLKAIIRDNDIKGDYKIEMNVNLPLKDIEGI